MPRLPGGRSWESRDEGAYGSGRRVVGTPGTGRRAAGVNRQDLPGMYAPRSLGGNALNQPSPLHSPLFPSLDSIAFSQSFHRCTNNSKQLPSFHSNKSNSHPLTKHSIHALPILNSHNQIILCAQKSSESTTATTNSKDE